VDNTRYARVTHRRQWSNYNIVIELLSYVRKLHLEEFELP